MLVGNDEDRPEGSDIQGLSADLIEAARRRNLSASLNTVHLMFARIRIAGSRLLVGPRDLRIGYPDIFRFMPLGPKRPFRCGTRI
jgi:hypothetical protein